MVDEEKFSPLMDKKSSTDVSSNLSPEVYRKDELFYSYDSNEVSKPMKESAFHLTESDESSGQNSEGEDRDSSFKRQDLTALS